MASEDAPSPIQWRMREDIVRPQSIRAEDLLQRLGLALDPTELGRQDPEVFIEVDTRRRIRRHLRRDLTRELGGLLYGEVYEDSARGFSLVVVWAAARAEQAEGGPAHVRYNEQSWASIDRQRRRLDPSWTIVGNYHSHPGIGVFLSATDLANQAGFFTQSWQLALIIDPVQEQEGLWAGPRGLRLDGYRTFTRRRRR